MKTFNSHINESIFDIINKVPEGIHVYYNKRCKRFECHYESDLDSDNLIKTPCAYEMNGAFKQEFYRLLTEDEYELATSYPFKRGYFDYLREIGLYEVYETAQYNAKVKALTVWFIKHNISFPTNGIDVDLRYI